MPKTKTIEIDEILPAEGGGKAPQARSTSAAGASSDESFPSSGASPFPDLKASLGWKARLTLTLTQCFLILRSKSWGKWVIAPLVVLFILLVIPLAILGVTALIITSILRSLIRK